MLVIHFYFCNIFLQNDLITCYPYDLTENNIKQYCKHIVTIYTTLFKDNLALRLKINTTSLNLESKAL